MVAIAKRFQRINEPRPLPVGVFEDDSLLLGLAARSRCAEFACPRASGAMNSDDLAFELARLVDADTWDL